MKKIITICFFLFAISSVIHSQPPSEVLANRIAQKMKDSLSLSSQQKDQVYTINILLHNRKMALRRQHPGSDSLRVYLQRVENTRDSLYRTTLSENKYLLYKQKKRNLVNSH